MVAKEFERERQRETADLRAEIERLEAENEFVRLKGRQEARKYGTRIQ